MFLQFLHDRPVPFILSWILCAIPIIVALNMLTYPFQRSVYPLSFQIWIVSTFLLLTPMRYVIFQLLLTLSYSVQSLFAVMTVPLFVIYAPLIAFVTALIAFAPGILAVTAIVPFNNLYGRMWVAAIVGPVIFLFSTYLYFLVLPYLAIGFRWTHPNDIRHALNGPAYYAYRFLGVGSYQKLAPALFPNISDSLPLNRMIAHLNQVYISTDKQLSSEKGK